MTIGKFVLKRGIHAVITVFIVLTLMFLVFRVFPADPAALLVDPTMCPDLKHDAAVQYGFEEIVDWEKHLAGLEITQDQTLVISYTDYPDLLSLPPDVFSFNVTLTKGEGCNAADIRIYHDGRLYGTEPDGIYDQNELVGESVDNASARVTAFYRNGIPTYVNNTEIIVVIYGENITGTGHFDLTFGMKGFREVPLYRQYFTFMKMIVTQDFGHSFTTGQPAWDVVSDSLMPTLLLMGSAALVSFAVTPFVFSFVSKRRGKPSEKALFYSALFFYSLPVFWFSLILLWYFSLKHRIFALGGMSDPPPEGGWHGAGMYLNILWHLSLPLIILSAVAIAGNIIFMRGAAHRTMKEDFVRTAEAKGLRERAILFRHALRNGFSSMSGSIPLLVGVFISVELILEYLFSWPGIGFLILSRIIGQDFPVVQAAFFVLALISVAAIFLFEMIHAYLDPRVVSGDKEVLNGRTPFTPFEVGVSGVRGCFSAWKRNRAGLFAAGIILMFVLTAVMAPYISNGDPMGERIPETDRYAPQTAWVKYMNATPEEIETGSYEHITTGPVAALSTYSPIVRVVYMGTDRGNVYSLNTGDGFPAWIKNVDGSRITAIDAENEAAVGLDAYLYVCTESGLIAKIHDSSRFNETSNRTEGNGVILWDYSTGAEITAEPLVDFDSHAVYVANRNGDVLSLDIDSGELIWQTHLGGLVIGSMALSQWNSTLFVGTAGADGTLYALSPSDGQVTFHFRESGPIEGGLVFDEKAGRLYYSIGDTLYSVSASTPQNRSTLTLDATLTAPEVDTHTGTIYVASEAGTVYSIRSDMGIRWESPGDWGAITTAPFYFDMLDLLYFGTESGKFVIMDASDGTPRVFVNTRTPISGRPLPVISVVQEAEIKIYYQKALFITTGSSVRLMNAAGMSVLPRPPTWIEPAPSGNTYLLGTDSQGRDVWSQMVYGSRSALITAFMVALFSLLLGLAIGLMAGYLRRLDAALMLLMDSIMAVPFLALLLIIIGVTGPVGGWLIFVIASPYIAGSVRLEIRYLRNRPYVMAARDSGEGPVRIFIRHIAPDLTVTLISLLFFLMGAVVLVWETLNFIGLGDPTHMSWGMILRLTMCTTLDAWWWLFPPGLAIALLSFSLFLAGKSIKDACALFGTD